MRTVYIECDDNLDEKEVITINDVIQENQEMTSAEVYMEAKEKQVTKDEGTIHINSYFNG